MTARGVCMPIIFSQDKCKVHLYDWVYISPSKQFPSHTHCVQIQQSKPDEQKKNTRHYTQCG